MSCTSLALTSNQRQQRFRSGHTIRLCKQVRNLRPIDVRQVEPQAQPPVTANILGNMEFLRASIGKGLIDAASRFAIKRQPSVTVVIFKIPTESLAANLETQVVSVNSHRCFRKLLDKVD